MPEYDKLESLLAQVDRSRPQDGFEKIVIPYLQDVWIRDYRTSTSQDEIVQVTLANFSYLFDVINQRLISAWGIPDGPHQGARNKSRMSGHPNGYGPLYHRGHAIPHSAGGGVDINLVPQLGSLNIGAFRVLERRAVESPGSLYFTCWKYGRPEEQKPRAAEQGLLRAGEKPEITKHAN